MNDQFSMNNTSLETVKVKKDLSSLVEDSVFQLGKYEDNPSQTANKSNKELTMWMEDSASQLSKRFEKLKDNLKRKVIDVVGTVKKDIGIGLDPYSSKAQKVAGRVLSGIRKKAFRHPWVAISTALAVGFLLGSLIRPTRKVMKLFK